MSADGGKEKSFFNLGNFEAQSRRLSFLGLYSLFVSRVSRSRCLQRKRVSKMKGVSDTMRCDDAVD